jgi:hypothetical protein
MRAVFGTAGKARSRNATRSERGVTGRAHAQRVCMPAGTAASSFPQARLCSRPTRAIRFSSRHCKTSCRGGQRYFRAQAALQQWILEPTGNVKQKQEFAEKLPITLACCLGNTRPKTRWHRGFRAVPLLRVQGRSVIVSVRRRGASRSRPVFKSCRLRPSRSAGVSEGAMRLKRGPRGQGNQPQGVSPNGIRNLP